MPENRPKRPPGPVDFELLKEQQREAADKIIDFVEGKSEHRMFLLRGYAGTGKTFLISLLEEWLIYAKKKYVAITAPTNKAVQILKKMSAIEHQNLTFSTIHSLLGLKEQFDLHTGKLQFLPDPMNPPSLDGYDILVVDEVSMLDDMLFTYIEPFVDNGLRILFVGDPAQIPPVNKFDCIPFTNKGKIQYKIGSFDLTDIHRQAVDNPILAYASAVRDQRLQRMINFELETKLVDGSGIIIVDRNDKEAVAQICEVYFNNEFFRESPDFMKVIAWTNKVVDNINDVVRKKVLFKDQEVVRVMADEKLIADKPIVINSNLTITTNAEMRVKDYRIISEDFEINSKKGHLLTVTLKYYQTNVEMIHPNSGMIITVPIKILHEDDDHTFEEALKVLKTNAFSQQGYDRADAWKSFYTLDNKMAKVKYNYAITAHKSQGSTYENCMVVDWNIEENPRHVEKNRIRYVSVTRAKSRLFIIK